MSDTESGFPSVESPHEPGIFADQSEAEILVSPSDVQLQPISSLYPYLFMKLYYHLLIYHVGLEKLLNHYLSYRR